MVELFLKVFVLGHLAIGLSLVFLGRADIGRADLKDKRFVTSNHGNFHAILWRVLGHYLSSFPTSQALANLCPSL
jgi:hypothetical protein